MLLLTGHGIFGAFRKRIGKDSDCKCYDCADPNNDAEHVLFGCQKWAERRTALENSLGEKIDVDNLMATVTANDENWKKFGQFCITVMCHRRKMEKAMEAARKRTSATTARSRESSSARQFQDTDGRQRKLTNWLKGGRL
ncbi:uncharacterized protein LOC132906126 [Bombus pascuorum]|uniref:uncharacterized protein LOC132906126 n=1 Tax=Bombus pascuorum TaxID=65598 RepID=UPI00298DD261|nr:uncharacterized protein LOC132906126 [Bombus pascuorum]